MILAMSSRKLICLSSKLARPLEAVRFRVVGLQDGFVFRTKNNELKAYANVCAHRGLELDLDEDNDYFDAEGNIRCKAHDARFDANSGFCIKGPRDCFGKKMLKPLEISEENGKIYLESNLTTELDWRNDIKVPTPTKQ